MFFPLDLTGYPYDWYFDLQSNQFSLKYQRITFKFSSFVFDFRIRNCESESETMNTNPKPT